MSDSRVSVKLPELYALMQELDSEAGPEKFTQAQHNALKRAMQNFESRLINDPTFADQEYAAWLIYQQQNTPLRKLMFLLLDRDPLFLSALDKIVGKKNSFSIHPNHLKILATILKFSPTDSVLARNLGYYLCCPELCNINTNTAGTLIRMLGMEPEENVQGTAHPTWGHGDIYSRVDNTAGKRRKSLVTKLNASFQAGIEMSEDNHAAVTTSDAFYYQLYFGNLPNSMQITRERLSKDRTPANFFDEANLEWSKRIMLIKELFNNFSEEELNQIIQKLVAEIRKDLVVKSKKELKEEIASPIHKSILYILHISPSNDFTEAEINHLIKERPRDIEKLILPLFTSENLTKRLSAFELKALEEKVQSLRERQTQGQHFKPYEQRELNRVVEGFLYFCQRYINRGICPTHEHLARYAMELVNPMITQARFTHILQAMIIHLNERDTDKLINHVTHAYNALHLSSGEIDVNYPSAKSLTLSYLKDNNQVLLSDEVSELLTDFSVEVARREASDNVIQRWFR